MAKKGKYVYEHPRPMVTVDAAVFALTEGKAKLLLVQRKQEPYQGAWALPGGFVDIDEDLPEAAARELAEETGLKDVPLKQLHTFGKPGRDPRGRTITVVYFGIAGRNWQQIEAAGDAAGVQWFDIENLPSLAFDHDEIAGCAIRRLKELPARALSP
jgi:8-oxo-dGTP diphosphatase